MSCLDGRQWDEIFPLDSFTLESVSQFVSHTECAPILRRRGEFLHSCSCGYVHTPAASELKSLMAVYNEPGGIMLSWAPASVRQMLSSCSPDVWRCVNTTGLSLQAGLIFLGPFCIMFSLNMAEKGQGLDTAVILQKTTSVSHEEQKIYHLHERRLSTIPFMMGNCASWTKGDTLIMELMHLKLILPGIVTLTCNPSYTEGRGRSISVQGQPQAKAWEPV
jgi:hypothetical protein